MKKTDQSQIIIMGALGVAAFIVWQATKKPTQTGTATAATRSTSNEPFRARGDGSTGNWQQDFGWAQDKGFLAMVGL